MLPAANPLVVSGGTIVSDPALIAVLASEKEKRVLDAAVYAEWGTRLTVQQFLRREEVLRSSPWARRSMHTWLLVRPSSSQILSSLETYRVRSRHGIRNGWSFEIASVFTEPSLRRLGYATRLLDEISARLGENPRAHALTLCSDIGVSTYERAGFSALPSFDWVLAPRADAAPGVTRSDAPVVVERLLAGDAPRGRFALLPDAAQADWHRARERIYAELLRVPTVAHGSLQCAEGHALIAGDLKLERLMVLRLHASRSETAEKLLRACCDEAARAGLREVVMWAAPYGGDQVVVAAAEALGGRRLPREGSVPMVKALPGAPRIDAAAWREADRLVWV